MTVVRFIDNLVAGNLPGRSRIINGAMLFDQRDSAGSPVVASTGAGGYGVDRVAGQRGGSSGTFETKQDSASPPDEFKNYLRATVTAAQTSGASDFSLLVHHIEGQNLIDLGFSKSWAERIARSFLVRSSLAGTYSFSIRNGGNNRHFITEFTLSANVWKKIELPIIPADTGGVWLDDNGIGATLIWDLGSGSAFRNTPDVWGDGNDFSTTNQVDWIGTAGATFDITGVQFERGIHTPFDWRLYGTEQDLCRRYTRVISVAPGTAQNTTQAQFMIRHEGMIGSPVPSVPFGVLQVTDVTTNNFIQTSAQISINENDADGGRYVAGNFVGMTTGRAAHLVTSSNEILLDAEL